ncbi:uncharacterized protein LOC116001546 isoform X1 [Ipomoea triloba]|uniref:uncharacterized protein LOC116001546 isoform X1 n=1 Tax=Ipomoea triloba TaxID=35885 RepID=UPI00125CFCAD|nr:uncharacterized protein LOC116001546 isoform X1 [Ipomoea triloba]
MVCLSHGQFLPVCLICLVIQRSLGWVMSFQAVLIVTVKLPSEEEALLDSPTIICLKKSKLLLMSMKFLETLYQLSIGLLLTATHRITRFLNIMYISFSRYGIAPGMKLIFVFMNSSRHPISKKGYIQFQVPTKCNKDHTVEWIEKHYPGLFQNMYFGNHFALNGKSIPKSEICRSLGAKVLIDDNPRYAIECAEVGMKVLLFDYENSYPWCKAESVEGHPLVTKVHNWEEVEQQLVSWTFPKIVAKCARGSPKRQSLYQRVGHFQVPYLEDPNTGVQMFESAEIVEYLRATYAL